jgi:predicted nucleotidyltransferase
MRLTQADIELIRSTVRERFGAGTEIWLFGSRLDDQACGGDINLYVEPSAPLPENVFLAREALRRELQRGLNQPVDMIVRRGEPTAFMRQAREEGRRL